MTVLILTILYSIYGMDVNKDSGLKAKTKTKDWRFTVQGQGKTKDSSFVLKDNQGPRPRTTSLICVTLVLNSGVN